MRLINADELLEHVWRDAVDTREKIADMINRMPSSTSPCALCIYSPPRPCTVCEDCPAKGRKT